MLRCFTCTCSRSPVLVTLLVASMSTEDPSPINSASSRSTRAAFARTSARSVSIIAAIPRPPTFASKYRHLSKDAGAPSSALNPLPGNPLPSALCCPPAGSRYNRHRSWLFRASSMRVRRIAFIANSHENADIMAMIMVEPSLCISSFSLVLESSLSSFLGMCNLADPFIVHIDVPETLPRTTPWAAALPRTSALAPAEKQEPLPIPRGTPSASASPPWAPLCASALVAFVEFLRGLAVDVPGKILLTNLASSRYLGGKPKAIWTCSTRLAPDISLGTLDVPGPAARNLLRAGCRKRGTEWSVGAVFSSNRPCDGRGYSAFPPQQRERRNALSACSGSGLSLMPNAVFLIPRPDARCSCHN